MSQASKKTIAKYMSMVSTAGRVWTEGEIISFRSFLNMKLKDQSDVKDAIMDKFHKSLDVAPFQLTGEQQQKGLQWLIKTQVNKKGELRDAKTTFIGEAERSMLSDFESFEFVGLSDIANYHMRDSGYNQYVPVYRLNTTDGRYFEYTMGYEGSFEVVSTSGNLGALKTSYNNNMYTKPKLKIV